MLNLKIEQPTDSLVFHNTLSALEYLKASLTVLERQMGEATVQGETPSAWHVKKDLLNMQKDLIVHVGAQLEIFEDEENQRCYDEGIE